MSICEAATWFAACCTDTSACWPRPERLSRSYSAMSAAWAASAAPWYQAWAAGPKRSGARSLSPVSASAPDEASSVRSDDAQCAFGPVSPNGVIETCDQRVVDRGQRLGPQAPCGHRADRLVLDEHVGAAHEVEEARPVLGGVEVEHDALLAPVVRPEGQRALRARIVAGERADRPGG